MDKFIDLGFATLDYTHPYMLKHERLFANSNEEEVKEYYIKLNELLDTSDKPFVIVHDMSKAKWASSEERIAVAQGQKEMEIKYEDRYKKTFLILPNSILKMLLKCINIASKPAIPQKIYSNSEEAIKASLKEVESFKLL